MAGIKFSRKEFEKYIKLTKDVEERISMFGTNLESVNDEEIEISVNPNRPDLYCLHGFMRSFMAFLGKKTGLKEYKLNKPEKDFEVIVSSSTQDIRPYTACAIIKNMKFDDAKIKEIIDVQEKIHMTLGRNRKKIAIGIYPLEKITLPIRFEARKPQEIRFIPLESNVEMNGLQILQQHSTGREYAHLLEGKDKFPIFVDAKDEILSMPPIINSHNTGKVTDSTKDIFIECSGFELETLKKTLNIIVTMFADMGGDIYQMNVKHTKGNYTTPELSPEKLKLNIGNANKLLGIELKESDIKKNLERMGHNYDKGIVEVPAWRADIMHEVDIIEDIAIAHGYENFEPEIPNISFAGQENILEVKKRKIADILCGLNFLETSSYHLTTEEDQLKKMGIKSKEGLIEVEKSKTEYNILRNNLLHSELKILSQNVDNEYPQRIFEIGRVFNKDAKEETGVKENERLCISIASPTANFTEMKQVFDYIMRMIGKGKEYLIENGEHPAYIDGRCGRITMDGAGIGYLGEIAPGILDNLRIKMPVCGLEIDIEQLCQ